MVPYFNRHAGPKTNTLVMTVTNPKNSQTIYGIRTTYQPAPNISKNHYSRREIPAIFQDRQKTSET